MRWHVDVTHTLSLSPRELLDARTTVCVSTRGRRFRFIATTVAFRREGDGFVSSRRRFRFVARTTVSVRREDGGTFRREGNGFRFDAAVFVSMRRFRFVVKGGDSSTRVPPRRSLARRVHLELLARHALLPLPVKRLDQHDVRRPRATQRRAKRRRRGDRGSRRRRQRARGRGGERARDAARRRRGRRPRVRGSEHDGEHGVGRVSERGG